jgi:uncharacterized OB-fold protein
MKCLICGNEFSPKRSDAKFCSEACKQKNKRIIPDAEVVPNVIIDNSDALVKPETQGVKLAIQEAIRQDFVLPKEGVSKRTGLSYDYTEEWNGRKKQKCPHCGEPTWFPPCAACCDEKRKTNLK